ncbi:hypothetical protein HGRIS_000589 [Hohenbuehelia grisea]|uniref:Integrase core domain-containing protein n=1 Tax=Hohenbuehelia grisea TaxID=104357 RepID=A0ABR3JSA0_9AGAR
MRSTRNTRIERLWREVGAQFARRWRAFFVCLERLHHLDVDNPNHLWLLHQLFLAEINQDCDAFADEWNHHSISGVGHDQTPHDMRFLGELRHGKYVDKLDHIHPAILDQYYTTQHEVSGAEAYIDTDTIEKMIARDQETHIRHAAIDTPEEEQPFRTEQASRTFRKVLNEVTQRGIIPEGYTLDADSYNEVEVIKLGRAGKREEIQLPYEIWWPKAVKWAQGLDIMTRIQELM